MIVVTARFRLPPGEVERARPLMAKVINATLAEPGCLAYSFAEDVCEPGLFRVSEAWESQEALQAHFATPHMKQWQAEREDLGFHDRDVTVYEVGEPLSL